MDDLIKKEFPHNILRQPKKILGEVGEAEIKQMLDDIEYYQNRVEELEKTLPLNQQEIIQVLKDHKWNVEDKESLADLIDLIRAVEKAHGVV